jgi:thioester reductase-like protein
MPSYRRALQLPAWGLYASEQLVATVRADNAEAARQKFKKADMSGERVKKIAEKK